MQLSLVAYYGNKPASLRRLVMELQAYLQARLGQAFRPYQLDQVHATVIGLECVFEQGAFYSEWYRQNRGSREPVDFGGLLSQLAREPLDFKIRFGGFRAEREYGFLSRWAHPFQRSFSFQGNMAVVVGWPVKGEAVTDHFFQLRQSFESYSLCHKWHKDGYQDNDCYLVLGKFEAGGVPEEQLRQISRDLQEMLAKKIHLIPFNRDALSIVVYENMELPLESTRVFPLDRVGADHHVFTKYLK